ncbi:substrate-binding domain-containing protein [Thalassorhabdomicrobium marinisediminis]|uniref:substrate-binding domain-containing protein n=1 Tax=Thalassorhabdomicrobium marinisediminis TaxID=2170577 RepID=UPI002491A90A|nr:substrate-binding domain-containing protein [Thalassorhabdomicrobium marinisediminis]
MLTRTLSMAATGLLLASPALARDEIRIVGSSTVFPYTQAVAENFANLTGAPSPIVESTGTGGGMKVFCGGIGAAFPDLTGASRAMKPSEYALCEENGVTEVSEALIGYDGLSIAISRNSDTEWDLSLEEIYLALAAQVPVDGEWADNPHQTWADVNPDLPAIDILAYGPPPTSGTRDAFVELVMHEGCERLDFVKTSGFDSDWVGENCSRMRQDGPFVEAGENDNLIVQRLNADENAMGIFGFSFLYENLDVLKGVQIEGVSPSTETIADKSYPISRPLFVYFKNAHRGVIPNLDAFIEEYMSDDALEADGYLAERGLVALSDEARGALQDRVLAAVPMTLN